MWFPALLVFVTAMAADIVGMTVAMVQKGLEVDIFLLGVFVALGTVSVVLVVQFLRLWKFTTAAP